MVTVTTVEVGGRKIPITVNNAGTFTAEVGDGAAPITAKVLEEVVDKVKAAVKREQAKKTVEVTVLGAKFDGFEVSRGERDAAFDATLRGVAERTNRIMFTIGGKKVQSEGYGRSITVARKLTPAEVKQYKALVGTLVAAEKDLAAFVDAVRIDPEKAVRGE